MPDSASQRIGDLVADLESQVESLRRDKSAEIKAREAAEKTLAALRREIGEGPRDVYELPLVVRIENQEEGLHTPVASGFTSAVVTRPLYAIQREVIPFDGSGELTARLDDQLVYELGFSGSTRVWACLSTDGFEVFKSWWNGPKKSDHVKATR